MLAVIDRTKLIEHGGSALAFKRTYKVAENRCGRISQKHVDMVFLAVPFQNFTVVFAGNLAHTLVDKVSLLGSECMPSKLRTKHDVHSQMVNTVACTVKVKISDTLAHRLNTLLIDVAPCVERMLRNRQESSSKYYPTIPCVVSKSLIAKYQRNRKCRTISNLVIPICGDQGRVIKLEGDGVRIPALFKKQIIPVVWLRPIVGFVRSVEFLHRNGIWYAHITYNTTAQPVLDRPNGLIGVDRNSVGAVATLADPQNGKVLHLGFNPARTKAVWHGRKANLQSLGKRRLLHRIRNKQSRRTKHENHLVSKQIVDYAASHRRSIVVEKLENCLVGKIGRYSQKSQWSFFQLLQFILYKAALRGVMVIEVDPAYTSQECSRCHQLSKPNGKSFRCAHCGHNDHRDANAAFTLSLRVEPIGGIAWESERPRSALLVEPFPGTEAQQCA